VFIVPTIGQAVSVDAVAEATVEGELLSVIFLDGRRANIRIPDLPFSSVAVSRARASLDGSFVSLDGPQGSFDVTAHELAALAAGRSLTPPDLAIRVGKNIRSVREARKLSSRELARQSGIAAPNLSNYENGHVSPRLETLGRLAAVLAVTVADLVAVVPLGIAPAGGSEATGHEPLLLGISDNPGRLPREVTGSG
jgi:transcriptional regulator with XRE-family HTH domain